MLLYLVKSYCLKRCSVFTHFLSFFWPNVLFHHKFLQKTIRALLFKVNWEVKVCDVVCLAMKRFTGMEGNTNRFEFGKYFHDFIMSQKWLNKPFAIWSVYLYSLLLFFYNKYTGYSYHAAKHVSNCLWIKYLFPFKIVKNTLDFFGCINILLNALDRLIL